MAPDETPPAAEDAAVAPYAWYVLAVLVLVYVLNFIDRQMLTIFAADLKRDLRINDGQFGFLYGTSFGVFYALFGIPLGRLADRWTRTRLLALGLATWSAMTACSGLARNFIELGLARVGVGVGEASANPSAYSLIADYFPARRRAGAVAIYSSGIYIGGGLAPVLGTLIAAGWRRAFAPGTAPGGLAGWQVAFLAIGLPGLALTLWVVRLREPVRGGIDGLAQPDTAPAAATAWRAAWDEFLSVVPPFTLWGAARRGVAAAAVNAGFAGAAAAIGLALTRWLGDPAQWAALLTGCYALASWAQAQRWRDPAAFAAICTSRAFLGLTTGYGLIALIAYAQSGFGPLYALQHFHAAQGQVALLVGGLGALGGALGTIAGGLLADRMATGARHSRRIMVIAGALLAALVPSAIMLGTHSLTVFYAAVFPQWFLFSMALGAAAGTVVHIVPIGVRGMATAAFLLGATMLGLAIGPYAAGRISTATGDLRVGLSAVFAVAPVSLIALALAYAALRRHEPGIAA